MGDSGSGADRAMVAVDCVTLRRLSTDPKQGELSETEKTQAAPPTTTQIPSTYVVFVPIVTESSVFFHRHGNRRRAGSGSGCAVHIHRKLLVVLCGLGNISEKTPDTNCSTELAVAFRWRSGHSGWDSLEEASA
ncbi:unnamed protein product [Boreogadus saida]